MEVEECIKIVEENLSEIKESELVDIADSNGRVCACDVFSLINVPPYNKSAMDGYAVCYKDIETASRETPVVLDVIAEILAGDFKEVSYRKNAAVRVMTGSYIPDGFDTVVKQEDTDYGEDKVQIYTSLPFNMNYCPVGEDLKKGDAIIQKGTLITPLKIALMASCGISKVECKRQVHATVISTGTELTNAGETLAPGKIYSSISYMLSSSLKSAGVVVDEVCLVEDKEEEIIKKIQAKSDIIITTGGVSVGKKDLLPLVLESLKANLLFSRANIQPGTPTLAAMLGDKFLLCLSGNPYAAMVNYEIYIWNALSVLLGCKELRSKTKTATLQSPYNKINKNRRFIRAFYQDGKVTLPDSNNKSSVISNMTECNCFIDIPSGKAVAVGDEVTVVMMKCL